MLATRGRFAAWRSSPLKTIETVCRKARPILSIQLQTQRNRQYAVAAAAQVETEDMSHNDSFLQGNAAIYVDSMYLSWKADPTSVHVSWQAYFHNVENGHIPIDQAFCPPPGLAPSTSGALNITKATDANSSHIVKHLKVMQLVQAYQRWGHQFAQTDPLGMANAGKPRRKELQLDHYGLTEKDLGEEFAVSSNFLPGFDNGKTTLSLRDIIAACERIYCGSMGVEYMHISNQEEVEWIRKRLEKQHTIQYTPEDKTRILERLVRAALWEKFLATKFPNDKRFGLDGCESYLPALMEAIDRSAYHGIDNIQMGICHRGRMNVLHNVTGKAAESIFREFDPKGISSWGVPGDVKYHYGSTCEWSTPTGSKVHLAMAPNPSHLESVNPVVMGKTRAIQDRHPAGSKGAMMLNVHTDAAFSAQGGIYEVLGLTNLPGYATGGTLRMVVNNQVGFTTDAWQGRSTPYCTDINKMLDAPIFHVNADDVEAVCFAATMAADFRAHFAKDFVVDIMCYRKNGHNEMDQASFTQPTMYERIATKVPILEQYEARLMEEGVQTREEIEAVKSKVWKDLSEALENSKDFEPRDQEWLIESWKSMKSPSSLRTDISPANVTAVDLKAIDAVAERLGAEVPEGFQMHKNLERILSRRKQTVTEGKNIDWATAEALAHGTLLLEGTSVRTSGQDVERGTFSQRHAVLHDQKTNELYKPLSNIRKGQGLYSITNSSLSESAVMAYEYGYTLAHPNALVMWEAQFGDFANNAQCVIDQFIASAEDKWLQRSGLVLSLPHGYDGQGPEHTSARLERFLQLGNEDSRYFPTTEQLERQHQDANMQVVCMTSPANYFHVLRRQIHRDFRKPLVILFSKSLLRHPLARSNIEDFTQTPCFQPLIAENEHEKSIAPPEDINRVIFCSGQVYAALHKHREEHGIRDTAITRVEELHPFPWEQVRQNLDLYPNAKDIVWCQEETLNGGAWAQVMPRFEVILNKTESHQGKRIRYAGRDPLSSVAVGFKVLHVAEEKRLLDDAYCLNVQ